jgi:hypothetical protein
MELTVDNIRILGLGACMLQKPIVTFNEFLHWKIKRSLIKAAYPAVHSFGECAQFLHALRGDIEIPPAILPLAGYLSHFKPLPGVGDLHGVDVVLLEPNSPSDIHYGDHILNRTAICLHLIDPIREANPGTEVAKMTNLWLNKGLLGEDEATQVRLAEELIKLAPESLPDAEVMFDVLLRARARRREVLEGLASVASMIDRPLGVVTYTFQYLADGQAVSWPPGFREEVLSAAQALGLPVFEPSSLVREHGVETALAPDLRHYADDFLPTVGRAISEFAVTVAREASGGGELAAACS